MTRVIATWFMKKNHGPRVLGTVIAMALVAVVTFMLFALLTVSSYSLSPGGILWLILMGSCFMVAMLCALVLEFVPWTDS
jgi:hypothetical protein